MEEMLETGSPEMLESAGDALSLSHKALGDMQEAARVQDKANQIRFESLSEVADYFRAERNALQAMVKEVESTVLELMELQSSLVDLRNSLIEEYEIQQQITAAMREPKADTPALRLQQEESAPKPSFGQFFTGR